MPNARRRKGADVNNRNRKTKRVMMQMTKLATMMKVTMTTKVPTKKAHKGKIEEEIIRTEKEIPKTNRL